MKRLLLFLTLSFAIGGLQAQITGLELEEFLVHPSTDYSDGVNLDGYTTYRLYVTCATPGDFLSSVYGVQDELTSIWTDGGFWNSSFGTAVVDGVNPSFFNVAPTLEYDSYVTIGRVVSTDPGPFYTIQDPNNLWIPNFNAGLPLTLQGLVGGAWFTANLGPDGEGNPQSPNGFAGDDLKVLIGQFTTNTCLNGFVSAEVFVNANGNNPSSGFYTFSSCDATFGCTNPDAENYDSTADEDDSSCVFGCMLSVSSLNTNFPTCAGNNNGSIQIGSTGGQGAVIYNMNGGNNLAVGNWSNLVNNTYNIHIQDGAGCVVDTSITLVTPPIALNISLFQGIQCNGDNNAMITGTFSGGTGMIVFDMDANFDEPACFPDYTNLGPGSYSVWAMDENGCTLQSNSVNVVQPSILNIAVQNQSIASCYGVADAQLVMFKTGGTGDVDWSVDGGGFYQESNILNLAGGTYTVWGIDENGCTDTVEATVMSPDSITVLGVVTDILCNGDGNGIVDGIASGGNAGFTYSFNGGNYGNLSLWSNLAAGEYTIDVIDNEDCVGSTVVTVMEPDVLEVSADETDISCFGEEDGSFEIVGTGGTMMYTYSLDTITWGDLGLYSGLEAGTYMYYILDANGCEASGTATIAEPDELVLTIDASGPELEGVDGGFIDISIEGGTGDYDVSWTSTDGYSSSDEDIDSIDGNETYTVTVTDENGCSVSEEQFIDFIISVNEVFNNVSYGIMPNPNNGVFTLNISGLANQKVNYAITDVSGRIVAEKQLNTINGEHTSTINMTDAASGMYYLTLTIDGQSTTAKIMKQN
jgi:hypothetical protein